MYTCEEHDGCVVVHERPGCPVCSELEDMKNIQEDLENEMAVLRKEAEDAST